MVSAIILRLSSPSFSSVQNSFPFADILYGWFPGGHDACRGEAELVVVLRFVVVLHQLRQEERSLDGAKIFIQVLY